jgi:proteasome lid subunit RPN8/RPN11
MVNRSRSQNEECAVVVGSAQRGVWYGRLRQRWVGTPASVEFDWSWVLAREERRGDVIGFFHSHPSGSNAPSQRDARTMRAWVSCFGKPLLCVIQSPGDLQAYLFQTDVEKGQQLDQVRRFPHNVVVGIESEVD